MAPTANSSINNVTIHNDHESSSTKPLSMEGVAAKEMVYSIMSSHVAAFDPDTCRIGDGDAFIVADMGEIYRKHMDWKTHLPGVKASLWYVTALSNPSIFLT